MAHVDARTLLVAVQSDDALRLACQAKELLSNNLLPYDMLAPPRDGLAPPY